MHTFLPTVEAGKHGMVQRWTVPPGCVRLLINASGAQERRRGENETVGERGTQGGWGECVFV
jgi:hypothetical protein